MDRNEYLRDRMRKRIARGICTTCPRLANKPNNQCLVCLAKRKIVSAKYAEQRAMSGICKGCSNKVRKGCKRCYTCLAKNNESRATRKLTSSDPNYNEYRRRCYAGDVQYRLKALLRSRMRSALIHNSKKGSAVRDLGCSITEFRTYIESLFKPGMSWDNHGLRWELDHIRPLAAFDLSNREEFLAAAHYTNQQPLWKTANRYKWSKVSA